MDPDIPPVENCCDKEPFAFFGLASYWAQVLEHSALNLALVLRLPALELVSKSLFDELYAELTRRTFGHLVKAAQRVVAISDEDRRVLDEALDLRNILTHHYFREHAEDFVSEKGRGEMKEELQRVIAKFKSADYVLEKLYRPLWKKYGVDETFIEQELVNVRNRAQKRDNEA